MSTGVFLFSMLSVHFNILYGHFLCKMSDSGSGADFKPLSTEFLYFCQIGQSLTQNIRISAGYLSPYISASKSTSSSNSFSTIAAISGSRPTICSASSQALAISLPISLPIMNPPMQSTLVLFTTLALLAWYMLSQSAA